LLTAAEPDAVPRRIGRTLQATGATAADHRAHYGGGGPPLAGAKAIPETTHTAATLHIPPAGTLPLSAAAHEGGTLPPAAALRGLRIAASPTHRSDAGAPAAARRTANINAAEGHRPLGRPLATAPRSGKAAFPLRRSGLITPAAPL